MSDVLERLAATIQARRNADPTSSHTAQMLSKGAAKCAEKFGEEAIEAIIEAAKGDQAALTREAADVLYHLQVMLAASEYQRPAAFKRFRTSISSPEAPDAKRCPIASPPP